MRQHRHGRPTHFGVTRRANLDSLWASWLGRAYHLIASNRRHFSSRKISIPLPMRFYKATGNASTLLTTSPILTELNRSMSAAADVRDKEILRRVVSLRFSETVSADTSKAAAANSTAKSRLPGRMVADLRQRIERHSDPSGSARCSPESLP